MPNRPARLTRYAAGSSTKQYGNQGVLGNIATLLGGSLVKPRLNEVDPSVPLEQQGDRFQKAGIIRRMLGDNANELNDLWRAKVEDLQFAQRQAQLEQAERMKAQSAIDQQQYIRQFLLEQMQQQAMLDRIGRTAEVNERQAQYEAGLDAEKVRFKNEQDLEQQRNLIPIESRGTLFKTIAELGIDPNSLDEMEQLRVQDQLGAMREAKLASEIAAGEKAQADKKLVEQKIASPFLEMGPAIYNKNDQSLWTINPAANFPASIAEGMAKSMGIKPAGRTEPSLIRLQSLSGTGLGGATNAVDGDYFVDKQGVRRKIHGRINVNP